MMLKNYFLIPYDNYDFLRGHPLEEKNQKNRPF